MARGYRRRSHMGRSSAAEGPTIAGRAQSDNADYAAPAPISSPTSARARARASLTLSPAHCSHEKDQHGWQHEARDRARTLGSI